MGPNTFGALSSPKTAQAKITSRELVDETQVQKVVKAKVVGLTGIKRQILDHEHDGILCMFKRRSDAMEMNPQNLFRPIWGI